MTALVPTKLQAGEEYASVDDILACSDLPEATVRVPHWKRNGAQLVLRVRALSLEQKDAVLRESRTGDGQIDEVAQICATLREGCMVPRFTAAQAEQLRSKNPTALEQVAKFIWTLSALDQELIDALVQSLTGAAPPPPDDGA